MANVRRQPQLAAEASAILGNCFTGIALATLSKNPIGFNRQPSRP